MKSLAYSFAAKRIRTLALGGNWILRGKSYHSFAKKCVSVLLSLNPYSNGSRDIEVYSIGVVVIAQRASYTG